MSGAEATAAPATEVVTGEEAMTVTVSTEGEGGNELLAGKFKNQEDLVKGYKELEAKLGQQSQQPATEEADEEATETPEGTTEAEEKETDEGEDADDNGPYGKAVTEVLKAAELDPSKVAEEFETTGEVSEETYAALEKHGYPREMVDAYKRGVAQTEEATAQVTTEQITALKAKVGGDARFAEMQKWAGANASPEELAAYNDALNTGDFTKIDAAVSAMAQRFNADIGTEGDLLGGQGATSSEGYASEAEYMEDMAKPEYKTSQAFRDKVSAKLMRSPNVMVTVG